MTLQRFSKKKGWVGFVMFAFILLINTEFLTGRVRSKSENRKEAAIYTLRTGVMTSSAQQKRFENMLQEGKRLMQEEFDYEGAIQKFNEASPHAETAKQKSDLYFYLSLAYYATLDARGRQPFEDTVRKLIEVDYHRALDKEICPPRYIEWYQEIKKEYGAVQILSKPDGAVVYLSGRTEPLGKTPLIVGIRAGETKIALQMGDEKKEDTINVVAGAETLSPLYGFEIVVVPEEKEEEEAPEVAVQEGEKKGGGKSMLFIIGGLVVAGGAAAAILLGGGGDGDNGAASTGSIQVNSSPTGANVYLDGQNTGRTTNTTLTGVTPGSHTVEVLKNGYGDYETSVSVTEGQTATVNATLSAHTIEVTQPTEATSWTQGENVSIRWTTGGGSSQLRANGNPGGIGSLAHIIRMNRMRAARSNPTARASRERATRRSLPEGGEESDSFSGDRSARNETPANAETGSLQGNLNTPRNASLSRINLLGTSQNASPNNTVKPQTLSNVTIELYRGGSLETTIVSDAENTGRYNWTVGSSIPDATNYKIRVSARGDSSVSGESPKFTIAKLGELRVTSKPTGATIWVDGVSKGETNKTLELPADDYKLKLTLDRYKDWDKGITIEVNQRTTVNATLEPDGFDENFNSGKALHWKGDQYATWKVENGIYKVMEGGNYRHTSYYDLGAFENNWTYEVEANRAVGEHGLAHGPAFCGSDDFKTFYYFDIDSGDQYWSIWRISNNTASVVRGWAKSAAIKQEGWNKFKIVAKGKSFTFYANGTNLGTVNIASVPNKGKIGVVAWTGSDVSQVWFDNISLELSNVPLTNSVPIGEMVTPIPVNDPNADSGRKKIK